MSGFRREIAVEEAAHAAAAWVHGVQLEEVTAHPRRSYCKTAASFEVDADGRPIGLDRQQARAQIVIRIVGAITAAREEIRIPAWPGTAVHDQQAAEAFADAVSESLADSERLLAACRHRAVELSREPYFKRLVEALARQLEAWPHRLDGAAAESALAAAGRGAGSTFRGGACLATPLPGTNFPPLSISRGRKG